MAYWSTELKCDQTSVVRKTISLEDTLMVNKIQYRVLAESLLSVAEFGKTTSISTELVHHI